MWHPSLAHGMRLLLFMQLAFGAVAFGQAPSSNDGQARLTVTVTNSEGLPITGLKREHFAVFSDKAEQAITFFNDQPEPASIVFLVDTSGSMDAVKLRSILIRAFRDFVQISHSENEYALLVFNKETRLLSDWTRDQSALSAGLASLAAEPAKGQTALYAACQRGLDLLERGAYQKRVLIVFSDGSDNASPNNPFGKLRQAAGASGALIYGVNLQIVDEIRQGVLIKGPQANEQPLHDLAKDTGGWAFIAQGEYQLNAAFEKIALQMRTQYTLSFRPVVVDGKWHRLSLKLKLPAKNELTLPSLQIKHRAGFLAAGPAAQK